MNALPRITTATLCALLASIAFGEEKIAIFPAAELEITTEARKIYELESSPDMASWNLEQRFVGTGGTVSSLLSTRTSARKFYRLVDAQVPYTPLEFAAIPAGEFVMGSQEDGNEHAVSLSEFIMQKTVVTNEQMALILDWAYQEDKILVNRHGVWNRGDSPKLLLDLSSEECRLEWTGTRFSIKEEFGVGFPCILVTWFGAAAYCNFLSELEGYDSCYDLSNWTCNFDSNGYRLPTEAEWEKAARGGQAGLRFPWGDTISHAFANYESIATLLYDVSPTRGYHPDWYHFDLSLGTSRVDAFAPNNFGLYDMAGNVAQWCNDWWSAIYYQQSPYENPTGPSDGQSRTVRNGPWDDNAWYCRSFYRGFGPPEMKTKGVGFRVAARR